MKDTFETGPIATIHLRLRIAVYITVCERGREIFLFYLLTFGSSELDHRDVSRRLSQKNEGSE